MWMPIWAIWTELPTLLRLFLLLLSLVSIYTLISASLIMLRLRSLATHSRSEDIFSPRDSSVGLQTRCANLRDLLGSTFYFFGFIFFLVLPLAARVDDNGRTPLGIVMFDSVLKYLGLAADVFFVLLILHLLHWVVAARVRTYALRSKERNLSHE
jgi:hypothetical protein